MDKTVQQTALILVLSLSTAQVQGSSLSFVIDVTGSMGDDIEQVKAGSAAILNAALNNPHQVLVDFIIVPFRDPFVENVTQTHDSDVIADALRDLTVAGGGDCPEVSLAGIKKALELSWPKSYIYVFTDASAKDHMLVAQVIDLIQETQSKVTFVMTGQCGNQTEPGFTCYIDIAAASSGEVFVVDKDEVETILDTVIEATLPDADTDLDLVKLNLLSLSFPSASNSTTSYNFTVDGYLDDFTISLSGRNPELAVYGPDVYPCGSITGELKAPSTFTVILNLANVYTIKFVSPAAGIWRLDFSSASFHTLRVTGTSSLDFDQRFGNSYLLIDFSNSTSRPISGVPTYIYINCTGLSGEAYLQSVTLVNLEGEILETRLLHESRSDNSIYYSDHVIIPSQPFNIWLSGVGGDNSVFVRSSKSAFTPLEHTVEDECALGKDNCDRNATCLDTTRSFHCECDEGFTGDGIVCEEVVTGKEITGASTTSSGESCTRSGVGMRTFAMVLLSLTATHLTTHLWI